MKVQKRNAQDIQDEIFRKMSAEKKISVGFQLWRLAKTIVGDKISGTKPTRPSRSSHKDRKRIR